MSRIPLHKDLVALDRAHQAVMQQLALEQAAAWDESNTKQDRDTILATVQRKLELHMTEYQAEWGTVHAALERQANLKKQMEETGTRRP